MPRTIFLTPHWELLNSWGSLGAINTRRLFPIQWLAVDIVLARYRWAGQCPVKTLHRIRRCTCRAFRKNQNYCAHMISLHFSLAAPNNIISHLRFICNVYNCHFERKMRNCSVRHGCLSFKNRTQHVRIHTRHFG